MAKNDIQYGGWNSYTLQCGTITTLISPGDCTLQCGMWVWNRDSEFTKWQHPAMWYVALKMAQFDRPHAVVYYYNLHRFRVTWRWIIHRPTVFLKSRLEVNKGHSAGIIQNSGYRVLFAFHSNYGSVLYHFRDKARHGSKIAIFIPLEYVANRRCEKSFRIC